MAGISLETLNAKIILCAVIGLGLSVYAFIVEAKLEADDNYEAMCDIQENISCTKAFSSAYGKGFGLIPSSSILYYPNSFYGIIHYTLVIILSFMNTEKISLFLLVQVILSCISSIYFAYILYFILADLCIVCVGTYIVNAALLMYTVAKHAIIKNKKIK